MRYTCESPVALDLTADASAIVPIHPSLLQPPPLLHERVLLLDDDGDFREVLTEYLTTRLYDVTPVTNGADGVREIARQPFDLILCDMMMPQVDGEMFYWAVSRLRPAARLRFVFVTGHCNDTRVQSFFQRVNATVLMKPFAFEALNGAIFDVRRKVQA